MYDGLQISQRDNGNIVLSIPQEDDRLQLLQEHQNKSELILWAELFGQFSCNGSYTPIDPEVHMVGLTSDPYIIGEEVSHEENGDITVYGKMWHYPNHMVMSVLEQLIVGMEVTLKIVFDEKEGEKFQSHQNRIRWAAQISEERKVKT